MNQMQAANNGGYDGREDYGTYTRGLHAKNMLRGENLLKLPMEGDPFFNYRKTLLSKNNETNRYIN